MIVIVGSPAALVRSSQTTAAGLAPAVARAGITSGALTQLVGRLGDDPIGDAVLLDLAAAGIGHVALLRTSGAATPASAERGADDEAAPATALDDETLDLGDPQSGLSSGGLPIDAGDVDLALRYLPDYRVVVVVADLDPAAWATAIASASWSGAHLIGLVAAGGGPADPPQDATILERPTDDEAEGAFASMVGRYAAGLDAGEEPAAAFAAASSGAGWASVAD